MLLEQPKSEDQQGVNFPFGFALLLILQTLFFFTVQFDDSKYRQKALDYYFQSELYKIEFPLYVNFLKQYISNSGVYERYERANSGNMKNKDIYWMQRFDPYYQKYLNSDQIPQNSLSYMKWQEKRRQYLQMLKDDTVQEYGFKSAAPDFLSMFVNLFLQSSGLQFFINFIFLVIIGGAAESIVGFFGILFSYMLFGFIMLSAYCILMPYSLVPLLGASGAVGGLVGMASAFYGFKKVRLYYYADSIKFIYTYPFYFLCLWALVQVVELNFHFINSVNFFAQLAPLILGCFFGFLIRYIKKQIIHYNRTQTGDNHLEVQLKEAFKLMSSSDMHGAKTILYSLLREYPSNIEVHVALFNIVKLSPNTQEYYNVVKDIFLMSDVSKSTLAMVNLVFNNYYRNIEAHKFVEVDLLFSLLRRFRKVGYLEDAEKILYVLMKENKQGRFSEMLARELWMLVRVYLSKKDKVQSQKLLSVLLESFPQTESAQQANNFLRVNKAV